jgi:hypothetical protein
MYEFTFSGVTYTWTQAQMDAFWARYCSMKVQQARDTANSEPEFKAQVVYCALNKLYGFGNGQPAAGSGIFPGYPGATSGPVQP